jgi:hypothetical protein
VRGLYKTGRIVTSAGVIMSIAFSSLLFSTSGAMNLLSYYTVAAVIFDTFVVRVFVVPGGGVVLLSCMLGWSCCARHAFKLSVVSPALFSILPDFDCVRGNCCKWGTRRSSSTDIAPVEELAKDDARLVQDF